jgi:hypothetical protein
LEEQILEIRDFPSVDERDAAGTVSNVLELCKECD